MHALEVHTGTSQLFNAYSTYCHWSHPPTRRIRTEELRKRGSVRWTTTSIVVATRPMPGDGGRAQPVPQCVAVQPRKECVPQEQAEKSARKDQYSNIMINQLL